MPTQKKSRKAEELAPLSADLQNLLAATDIATLFLDRELRVIRFTPRVEELFNVRPTDRGRRISDLTHRLCYPELITDTEQVLRTFVPVERAVGDDKGRSYLTRVLPYRSTDDRIEGVVITLVDISERVTAESALRESESHYRLLVESAREYAMIVLDREGQITMWNPGAVRIFGHREQEVLGRDGGIIFTSEDRKEGVLQQEMNRATRDDRASDERWHVRKDGSRFWASGVMEAVRNGAGELEGFAKVLRDNTERKQAQEKLRKLNETLEQRVEQRTLEVRRHEERFRKLVDASAAMVWTADARGMIVEDSPSWRAYTGQSFEQARGDGWAEAVHPDDREPVVRTWFEAVRSRPEAIDSEYRIYHAPTDTWRWTNVRAVPLRDDGAVHGWIGMNIDIDERKRAEDRTRQLASRLTVAEQAERRRISQVLHDELQQLLYGVEMKLSMCRRDLIESEQQDLAGLLDDARCWVDQAVDITRRLTVELSPPILNKEGLTDALAWLQRQMKELHGLEIEIQAEDACFIENEDLRVLLFQAVRELLFNVKKHAGVNRATVTLSEEKGRLCVRVADHGVGFDLAEMQRSQREKGGFGLFSLRERVSLIGGRLEIRSAPGKGTEIQVRIPVATSAR